MDTILYEKIGRIAHSANSPMTFGELKEKLGLDTNNRGVANYVKGAFNYFKKEGDENTASKISGVFTNNDGNYAY